MKRVVLVGLLLASTLPAVSDGVGQVPTQAPNDVILLPNIPRQAVPPLMPQEPTEDAALSAFAQEINKKYFESKLPKDIRVVWVAPEFFGEAEAISDVEGKTIYMNSSLRQFDRQARITVMHEMCHFVVTGHGLLFQNEMVRLAREGAFWGIW